MVPWLFAAAFLLHQAAGQVALTTPPYTRLVRSVTSICMSEDGQYIAIAKAGDGVYIYNKTSGSWPESAFQLPVDWATNDVSDVVTVSLSFDGSYIAAAMSHSTIGVATAFVRDGELWSPNSGFVITDLAGTFFGSSIDVSGDGLYIAMGSHTDNAQKGAVWAFFRSGTVWTQQGGKLVGSSSSTLCAQGYSVSINHDGTYIASGGFWDDYNKGATWVFARSGSTWAQQSGKLFGTGRAGTSRQGYAVSIDASGSYVAVGGPGDDYYSGAIWVFARSGAVWAQQGSKIKTSVGPSFNRKGQVIVISADGSHIMAGAMTTIAETFVRSGLSWAAGQYYSVPGDQYYSASGELGFGRGVASARNGYTLAISGVLATWIVDLPTPSPVAAPTALPTAAPTLPPTTLPTAAPTLPPTTLPTISPSTPHTLPPTTLPTAEPSHVPTSQLTTISTAAPTLPPTTLPTAAPSAPPTLQPTAIPSPPPTAEPSHVPTSQLTMIPTVAPTRLPTAIPTVLPTRLPTAIPSAAPAGSTVVVPTRLPLTGAPATDPAVVDAGAIISLSVAAIGGMILLALAVRFVVMVWVLDAKHPVPVFSWVASPSGGEVADPRTKAFVVVDDGFKN